MKRTLEISRSTDVEQLPMAKLQRLQELAARSRLRHSPLELKRGPELLQHSVALKGELLQPPSSKALQNGHGSTCSGTGDGSRNSSLTAWPGGASSTGHVRATGSQVSIAAATTTSMSSALAASHVEVQGGESDSESDACGSVVLGSPMCNPMHLLATQRKKAASGGNGSGGTSGKGASEALTATCSQAPGLAAATAVFGAGGVAGVLAGVARGAGEQLCRRDLSTAAAIIQGELLEEAAQAEAREGLADSQKGGKRGKQSKGSACFPYGNYNRYYGYRLGNSFDEDPRLQALDAAWFAGKRVLDIGCNEGVLTLSLACKFGCKSTVGVDIDGRLISKASRSLAAVRTQLTETLTQCGALGAPGQGTFKDVRGSVKALKRTRFQRMDYVNDADRVGRADTVLCLSVTKWVHFNWGDAGVRKLFARVHRTLHPGGLFVLEPQPWRSYKQVFKKQETLAALPFTDLAALELRPDDFVAYLCTAHSFKLLKTLQIGCSSKGFDRPLHILQKQ